MSLVSRHVPNTPAWFDLMAPDLEKARRFYGELFGWTFDIGAPEFGYYTSCKKNGHKAAGMGCPPPGDNTPPCWSMYFAVENAVATCEHITAAGGTVIVPSMEIPQQGYMAVATDVTGATFGMWQPLSHTGAEIVKEPGAMTWCEVMTRDAKKACAFYQKVFGLQPERMQGDDMEYYTLHYGKDHDAAAGIMQMDARFEGVSPHWMPYFAVADADKAAQTVKLLGGEVKHGPFDTPYGRILVITDNQGAALSLVKEP